jgi:hypothetical protein
MAKRVLRYGMRPDKNASRSPPGKPNATHDQQLIYKVFKRL